MATKKKATKTTKKQAPQLVRRSDLPYAVGDAVLFRTVTMILVGRVTMIGHDTISLTDGGWIADTGRFSTCLATGTLNEFERAPSWFAVGRGAIVDVWPWAHPLPQTTK